MRILALTGAITALLASLAQAEPVAVPSTSLTFPSEITLPIADKSVPMRITGTAMRKKFYFNVYAVASYLQTGVNYSGPAGLAEAAGVKMLHLVFEREVSGKDMADALVAGIRGNYPGNAFAAELANLTAGLQTMSLKKGDHVQMISVPGDGLTCTVSGQHQIKIANPAFAKAVWDIYLGQRNLGSDIQRGLSSR